MACHVFIKGKASKHLEHCSWQDSCSCLEKKEEKRKEKKLPTLWGCSHTVRNSKIKQWCESTNRKFWLGQDKFLFNKVKRGFETNYYMLCCLAFIDDKEGKIILLSNIRKGADIHFSIILIKPKVSGFLPHWDLTSWDKKHNQLPSIMSRQWLDAHLIVSL